MVWLSLSGVCRDQETRFCFRQLVSMEITTNH
ncbi:MAG TPA: hypothetical protein DHW10_03430 [Rhodospirillaceae bacterium]|nr:hypothetical protein [Rhodospirillaceae bacterium]